MTVCGFEKKKSSKSYQMSHYDLFILHRENISHKISQTFFVHFMSYLSPHEIIHPRKQYQTKHVLPQARLKVSVNMYNTKSKSRLNRSQFLSTLNDKVESNLNNQNIIVIIFIDCVKNQYFSAVFYIDLLIIIIFKGITNY